MKQYLQMMTAILVAAALLTVGPVPSARAESTGYLAGRVFIDADGNGTAEPDEVAVAEAAVYIQSQVDASIVYTATADAQGYFLATDLPQGSYQVWAQAPNLAAVLRSAEIGEVNAAVLFDLPVVSNPESRIATPHQVFAPLILR